MDNPGNLSLLAIWSIAFAALCGGVVMGLVLATTLAVNPRDPEDELSEDSHKLLDTLRRRAAHEPVEPVLLSELDRAIITAALRRTADFWEQRQRDGDGQASVVAQRFRDTEAKLLPVPRFLRRQVD